jgi:hypothetical protein
MRTAGVKRLMDDVLSSFPKPHTEDVVDEVFHAIENQPSWLKQYEDLCAELGKTTVNTWGGFWIAHIPAVKSKLIESYSKLTRGTPAAKKRKKIKEPDALKMMSDFYLGNRDKLPTSIVKHREVIVELLVEGYTPEEAFAKVQSKTP